MDITSALVRLMTALSGLSFLAALVVWGINKWGDQGGIGEKTMMSAIGAGVAFALAAGFAAANGGSWFTA